MPFDIPFGLGPGAALWVALTFLIAAFVRGYSGFGFSALSVSGTGLVMNPLLMVPVILLAEVLLTLQQARGIRPHIQWGRVVPLLLGCLAGVPLSIIALNAIGVDLARAVIALFILAMCGVLFTGWSFRGRAGTGAHIGTGLASGLANGAAVGGLPVAAFLAAQPISAAAFRATNIAYFALLDIYTLPLLAWQGLIMRDTFIATALFLPVMVLGIWLGSRRFLSAEPQGFRRFAVVLLVVLALLGLGKSLL